jgi:hypothetical protein
MACDKNQTYCEQATVRPIPDSPPCKYVCYIISYLERFEQISDENVNKK